MLSYCRHFYLLVDLFLVLSGFIISHVYAERLYTGVDYADYLRRRIARVAPLHWVTLLFYVVLGLAAATGTVHADFLANYDWHCLIPTVVGLQAFGICSRLSFNFVSWSISAEMGMYVIAPALLWLGRKSRWWPLLLAAVTIAVLCWISRSLVTPWYLWTWNFGVLRAVPDFTLGVAFFCFRQDVRRIPAAETMLLATLTAFLVGSMLDWPDMALLIIVYAAAVTGVACDLQGGGRRWIATLGAYGQLSYSMYLLHPIILTVLAVVVGRHLLQLGGTTMNCWLLLVLAAILPISYLSLNLFETPARRWIAGTRRRTG